MKEILMCFYRISDCFQKSPSGQNFNKVRPEWFSKRKCLMNFLDYFGHNNLFIIADCVGRETKIWLESIIPISQISFTNFGSGAESFLHVARMACRLPPETKIYLVEDDYLVTSDCKTCIIEGLDISDYVTTYDAPDKYIDAKTLNLKGCLGNPLIKNQSEETRLFITKSCHFKLTNSTTMTFATKAGTLQKDYPVYEHFCKNSFPRDFEMFRYLIMHVNRRLISSVPAKSTHCESAHLAPLVDWEIYT